MRKLAFCLAVGVRCALPPLFTATVAVDTTLTLEEALLPQVDVMPYAQRPSDFQVQLPDGTVAAVGVCAARLAGPCRVPT